MDNEEIKEIEDLNLEPENRMEQILNGETLEPEDRAEYFVQKALGRFNPTPSTNDFIVPFQNLYPGGPQPSTTMLPREIMAAFESGKNVYAYDEEQGVRLPCIVCENIFLIFSGVILGDIVELVGWITTPDEPAEWERDEKDYTVSEITTIQGEITRTSSGWRFQCNTSGAYNYLVSKRQLLLEVDYDGNRYAAPMVKAPDNPYKSIAIVDLGDNRSFTITLTAVTGGGYITTQTELTQRFALPDYSAADAGKLLGIDENGNLAWVAR